MTPTRLRSLIRITLALLCVALAASAWAKKPKERPLKVNPGGASQKWACDQLAESACDLAKRCEPDRSLRHCKKLRERCGTVKDHPSRSATEDDVTVCAQAVSEMTCKQVAFDNTSGVDFDLKKLEVCGVVSKDNPMPSAGADKDKDKDKDDDAPAKSKDGDDE